MATDLSEEKIAELLGQAKRTSYDDSDLRHTERSLKRISSIWIVFCILAIGYAVVDYSIWGGASYLVASTTMSVIILVISISFRSFKSWSRWPAIITAVIMLPAIPIGTLLGAYSIMLLVRGKELFENA